VHYSGGLDSPELCAGRRIRSFGSSEVSLKGKDISRAIEKGKHRETRKSIPATGRMKRKCTASCNRGGGEGKKTKTPGWGKGKGSDGSLKKRKQPSRGG